MLILLSGCKSVPDKSENTVTEIQGVQFSDIDDYDIDKEREFEIDLSTMSFWEKAKPIETKEYAVMYGNAKAYKAFFPILFVVNLEGDRILGLYNNNGGWCWFEYDATGRRHSISIGGMVFYYYYNAQGDVMGLRNTSGQSVVQYTYDSWGKLLSTTGTMATLINQYNPFRYRGYFYDEETGLYYLNSRYYDPETGRFLNADGQLNTDDILGCNMFAYCGNNPVNRVDPTGQFWKEIGNFFSNAWKGFKTWVSNTFGAGTIHSQKYEAVQLETIIHGSETGVSSSKVIKGDISKPISVYAETTTKFSKISDSKVGIQLNIGNGVVSFSTNFVEKSCTFSTSNYSIELFDGPDKIGYTVNTGVDFSKRTAETYYHEYIRPLPTLGVAVGISAAVYYFGGAGIAATSFIPIFLK